MVERITCAFKPGCLLSHNWLHTPDCKVSNEMSIKDCMSQGREISISLHKKSYTARPFIIFVKLNSRCCSVSMIFVLCYRGTLWRYFQEVVIARVIPAVCKVMHKMLGWKKQ